MGFFDGLKEILRKDNECFCSHCMECKVCQKYISGEVVYVFVCPYEGISGGIPEDIYLNELVPSINVF